MAEAPALAYSTFSAFGPHYAALARVGYYRAARALSGARTQLFKAYRGLAWLLALLYNLQHLVRIVQVRGDTGRVVDTLFILLTTLNTLGKHLTFNLRSRRVERLNAVIKGELFAAQSEGEVLLLREDAAWQRRLLALFHGAVLCCGALWTAFPLLQRARGRPPAFTGYFPFNTAPSPRFELAQAYMSIVITFQAYGNVTMDCTIVAFFAMARLQLRMLRRNFEKLADPVRTVEDPNRRCTSGGAGGTGKYMDEESREVKAELRRRLARCVEHYNQIVWFTKEVESIFEEALMVQFAVMAWVICMTVYKIVGLSLLSMEFVSMAVYLGCMLAQLFLYCYYGTQVKFENEQVSSSVCSSEWRRLSATWRRSVLLAARPRRLRPSTAYVVPMTLDTYLAVLRFSYTLFTFLDRK